MDNTIHEKINELTRRINELAQQQTGISRQLVQLINELEALKRNVDGASDIIKEEEPVLPPVETVEAPATHFEEFIGKNLASKVGILVTIIGIFIGAKYAIEHNMVKPIVRVISGYTSGIVLVALSIQLKKKYEAYSAVLMGGGLAVLYFITFITYSVYHLLPQLPAFALMLVFTAATVYAALWYNRVIIAHLGQVGAYAIPFLLSNNSGQYAVLFTYIAIINTGIMILSFRKYWKSLFLAAFGLTWIIYLSWYLFAYQAPQHTALAWTFLAVFFVLFYATFLSYKLIKKEQYALDDVVVLLGNAFAFYGIGYGLLSYNAGSDRYSGLFTLLNAGVHLVVSQLVHRLKLADKALYYLLLGLVIVFCTIAIPVQLDGNWVTLLWTAEAVLVFVIGRTRAAGAYEKLGAGLVLLGFISLLQDWLVHSADFATPGADPFLNSTFLTGLLVVAAQGTIIYFNRNKKYRSALPADTVFRIFYDYIVPVLLLAVSYFLIELEINGYFRQLNQLVNGADGSFSIWTQEIRSFAVITQLTYSMLFVIVVAVINHQWIRNIPLANFTLAAVALLLFVLMTGGWRILNERAVNYYRNNGSGLYFGSLNILVRYAVMAVALGLLFTVRTAAVQQPALKKTWLLALHTLILGLLSAEYLCWTSVSGAGNQFKLGLSIVWGVYALLLIVLGIRHKLKHLRLAAIVLFMVTLAKLFFYDLAGSGTITKTISFISLGGILLLVSFLYNKYKDVLFAEEKEQ